MNFRSRQRDDEPAINLIPLIDVLLVILIFLAATTSFTRLSQLDVALPKASSTETLDESATIEVAISQDGLYAINGNLLSDNDTLAIAAALLNAQAGSRALPVVIHADAQATHDSVIRVMEAAQQAGLSKIRFATQGAR